MLGAKLKAALQEGKDIPDEVLVPLVSVRGGKWGCVRGALRHGCQKCGLGWKPTDTYKSPALASEGLGSVPGLMLCL